ncbi:Hypothetical_protein [Hexamita inflata]|uniref:Hypothetical_protein n=1 Tax=Hexamita inflata TaxID=28002 RepID=A0AA86V1Y1_9EUKA|nr:Hypothetical protein HINF_LOCUS60751 [Hexamita inflata]
MQLLIKFDITQICTQPKIRLVRRRQRQVYKYDWNTVNHANFCNRQRMMLFVSTINSTLCYHICCTHILSKVLNLPLLTHTKMFSNLLTHIHFIQILQSRFSKICQGAGIAVSDSISSQFNSLKAYPIRSII